MAQSGGLDKQSDLRAAGRTNGVGLPGAFEELGESEDEHGEGCFALGRCVSPDSKDETAQPMFLDPAAMKEKIRKAAAREEYDVTAFYHTTGIWQAIARHPHFEKLTLTVISLNALWIAIDTDLNDSEVLMEAGEIFQIAEYSFCVYFSFEWFVRYKSFRVKCNGLRDPWFVFDSCLVFMMVMETWVMASIMLLVGGAGAGGLGNASILRMA
eukprot:CAMPEP_0115451988 /NCGR_PEP_ID=MMETSP0271-20121206/42361_1 /TAXON_ID=71861 /ORGANISM="Scrippsiella trochoidea, Strain CCMP3099" /LENGTH=211 /DNA_ID=CAMNT_0002878299 /DNA_START=35 /DNA_END=666 /DNA_ORIENTATION=+